MDDTQLMGEFVSEKYSLSDDEDDTMDFEIQLQDPKPKSTRTPQLQQDSK